MPTKPKKSILDFLKPVEKTEKTTRKESKIQPLGEAFQEKSVETIKKTYVGKVSVKKTRPNVTRSIWELNGKVIVIAEKPKAARKIAAALGRPVTKTYYNIPYYIIQKGVLQIIIGSAAGHLYGLHTEQRGYPVFTYTWKPLYEIDESSKHTYKFIKLLEKICKFADYYINACDYDIEGSVIGYLIIKFLGNPEKALRAKYSSLTPTELRESFRKLTELDWEMIEAGLCRHELDWIWGINISRALMDAVKKASRKYVVLSAGRVQTPTLKYVVEKDIERNLFIPIPQYSLNVYVEKHNQKIHLEYKGPAIETRIEAQRKALLIKKTGYLIVERCDEKKKYLNPPPAFNLGDLQEEAARIYGFSPYKTQSIAERLYLDALISYPRTNSQKLPPTLDYKGIMQKLSYIGQYGELVKHLLAETKGILKPVQGPKEDPAHPAIYPTGVKPSRRLSDDEWKIYDLIVRRFLAAFAPKAIVAHRIAVLRHPTENNILFQAMGQQVVYMGWLRYYPFSMPEERKLPVFRRLEKVTVVSASSRKTYTKPPEKLKKIEILRWMENAGIGTEATRARIIELLFKRGYLRSVGGKAEATDLGLGIVEVLMDHFPEITSVELTRHFEEEIDVIRKGMRRRDDVVNDAKKTLLKLLQEFNKKKDDIGKMLSYRLGFLVPEKKCVLCRREVFSGNLCKYHYYALEKLYKTYHEWKKREGVSWEEYLKSITRLKLTGKWVIEVAKNIDKLDSSFMVPY